MQKTLCRFQFQKTFNKFGLRTLYVACALYKLHQNTSLAYDLSKTFNQMYIGLLS
jgi:hypothetical protein